VTIALSPPRPVAPAVAPVRVLIAEDELHLGVILQQFLTGRGFDVTVARDGTAALDQLLTESFDVALLDIVMPGLDGLEVLRRRRELPDPPEMIIITGNGSVETAITALKLGAYDYLSKPYRMAEIEALVQRAYAKRRLTRDHTRLVAARDGADASGPMLRTSYAPLRSVLSLIERVATSDASMLIVGAPGTGKARLARYAHWHAERALGGDAQTMRPFASCDSARFTDDALAIELFGAERGTRRSADGEPMQARVSGLLELAAGGTVHLAHIERAARGVQRQLAIALQTRRMPRTAQATSATLPLTARLIATSSADLPALVARDAFDADLYDALTAVRVQLPPLRDRRVDLPLLSAALLAELSAGRVPSLTDRALEALAAYDWPGNIRELRNVLERALLLARGADIDDEDLLLGRDGSGGRAAGETRWADDHAVLRAADGSPMPLEQLERRQIVAVLEATDWHQGIAATQLGVSAKTLYRKIREFGLARPSDVPPRGRRSTRRRESPVTGDAE
jgi:DNA-binding NtrC family response regulator